MSISLFVALVTATIALAWYLYRNGNQAPSTKTDKVTKDVTEAYFDYDDVKISASPEFNVSETRPPSYRPWKSGKFVMTMGIIKCEQSDWLAIDDQYEKEQKLRQHLVDNHRDGVMQLLPGSDMACIETLQFVAAFMARRYPNLFFSPEGKPDYIHNKLTNKTFRITEPFELPPLQIAAQLAMEDLNVLIQGFGDDPEQHYLAASFSMAPAGWKLDERIGWPLWKIHGPVPLWQEKLRKSIERYFLKMKPEDLICRHNFFLQTTDVLFQQDPFLAELPEPAKIEDIRIRHERQTLRRLPKSRAILFTVRTYMLPITELENEPDTIREFLGAIRAMPPEMAKYKAKQVWGDVVEEWCESRLRSGVDSEVNEEPV